MLVPDVNVVINAETRSAANHEPARRWFDAAGNGDEILGVPEMVLLGFVRIATGPGVRDNRISPVAAFAVCDAIQAMPSYSSLKEGPEHWRVFRELVGSTGISGPDTTDAYLAAFAIENDATFVTFDRGFARFPGLKVFVPGD